MEDKRIKNKESLDMVIIGMESKDEKRERIKRRM